MPPERRESPRQRLVPEATSGHLLRDGLDSKQGHDTMLPGQEAESVRCAVGKAAPRGAAADPAKFVPFTWT